MVEHLSELELGLEHRLAGLLRLLQDQLLLGNKVAGVTWFLRLHVFD